jgi:hypothetical protein
LRAHSAPARQPAPAPAPPCRGRDEKRPAPSGGLNVAGWPASRMREMCARRDHPRRPTINSWLCVQPTY